MGHSIAPWVIGTGQQPNVVQVDGAGGQSFSAGTFGPEFDAQNGGTGAGAGVNQHYLDVANGANDFFQSFTVPQCSTNSADITYTLSGFFSLRSGSGGSGGVGASGSIRILNGVGTTGALVFGSTAVADIPESTGAPNTWVQANTTVDLVQGVTYSFVVQMPDPVNFDEASVTFVPASCPSIEANDDDFTGTPIDSNTGDLTATVLTNDTLNAAPVATDGSQTTISVTDDGGLTGVSIADDGIITVPANTPPGTYNVTYLLVDENDVVLTDPAVATVLVTNAILAEDDDFSGTPIDNVAGGVTPTVLTNDRLNGAPVATDGSETTISVTNDDGLTGVTIADDGIITVPANSPPGTYNVAYLLADENDVALTDPAIATIVVAGPIVAEDDDFSSTPFDSAGGTTPTVLTNDTLNGAPVATDGSQTTISVTNDGGLTGVSIADNGVITVPADATPGTYNVSYLLANEANTALTDPAIATVVVGAIVAVDDDFSGELISSSVGGTTSTVLTNDTLNGSPVTTDGSQTTIAVTDDGGLTGVSIADNGVITVPANTPAGTYNITYLLTSEASAGLSDPAIVTVVVAVNIGLVSAVEDQLSSTLQDNLSVTLTEQSQRISDYARSGLERLQSHDNRSEAQCAAAATLRAQFILFDTNKAVIKPESETALDDIVAILASCRGSAFEIAGHTDNDASEDYNTALSQRRVDAVLVALRERDVDTSGFVTKGYGESQPIAPNDTAEGKARNRRVEFNVIEGESTASSYRACHDGASAPRRNLNVNADENGVALDGDFQHQTFDCATNRWSIFEGSLGYTETESGIAQGSINLSYRREKLFDSDRLGGFFVGSFGSRSDVDTTATGSINGAGVNAGFYGAQKLTRGLFVDGHLGVATGFQDFDLAFDTALGEIDTSGLQHYFAGFAGAALSGEIKHDNFSVKPRIGFNYAASPGNDVDVTAALGNIVENGTIELDTLSGGSIFAEARFAAAFNRNRSEIALTPRVACFQSLGTFDDQCSFGGALELSTLEVSDGFIYSIELAGEQANDFSRLTLSGNVSKALRLGTVSATAGVGDKGNQQLNLGYNLKF
ncbi:MAG: OmpA family protein [Hyphomicrobiales bacterium]